MGVKSTLRLTRDEAESLYRSYFKIGVYMTDAELEEELEKLHDRFVGGEGFENYQIVPAS